MVTLRRCRWIFKFNKYGGFPATASLNCVRYNSTMPKPGFLSLLQQLEIRAQTDSNTIAFLSGDLKLRKTYRDLLSDVARYQRVVEERLESCRPKDTHAHRIGVLCGSADPYRFAVSLLGGAWANRAIAVPLSPKQAPAEWEYILKDTEASLVIADEQQRQLLAPEFRAKTIAPPDVFPDSHASSTMDPSALTVSASDPSIIVYTSGTTSRPKGVVHTHGSVLANLESMHSCWQRTSNDGHLGILPLHHVHGLFNNLLGSLHCGGWIWYTMDAHGQKMSELDAKSIWEWDSFWKDAHELARGKDAQTVVMAVPTLYSKWLNAYSSPDMRPRLDMVHDRLRLWISGSAALPEPIFHGWQNLRPGDPRWRILERYGMTEVGMALSNPLHGERIAGTVGLPMPGVEAKITGSPTEDTSTSGDLWIRGANTFQEYWRRPDITRASFDQDGWFQTGDVAQRLGCNENRYFKILGRASVDIIKSGGYKISALEIERELLQHPEIAEVAVLGVPDNLLQTKGTQFGEHVAAVVVLSDSSARLGLDAMRSWLRPRISSYKLPTILRILPEMPRNHMGKVNKKDLLKRVFQQSEDRS